MSYFNHSQLLQKNDNFVPMKSTDKVAWAERWVARAKQRLKDRNERVDDYADAIGVDAQSAYRRLQGKHEFKPYELVILAERCDWTVSELLDDPMLEKKNLPAETKYVADLYSDLFDPPDKLKARITKEQRLSYLWSRLSDDQKENILGVIEAMAGVD